VGLTTTVTVVVDEQPFAEAVIVNVVVCCVDVVFVRVPDILEPPPLAAIPVRFAVLSLDHVKDVPLTLLGLVIVIPVIEMPEHWVCVLGVALTVGIGFTVTVTVPGKLVHPLLSVTVTE
jgi:hypothetical protein